MNGALTGFIIVILIASGLYFFGGVFWNTAASQCTEKFQEAAKGVNLSCGMIQCPKQEPVATTTCDYTGWARIEDIQPCPVLNQSG